MLASRSEWPGLLQPLQLLQLQETRLLFQICSTCELSARRCPGLHNQQPVETSCSHDCERKGFPALWRHSSTQRMHLFLKSNTQKNHSWTHVHCVCVFNKTRCFPYCRGLQSSTPWINIYDLTSNSIICTIVVVQCIKLHVLQ